MIRGRLAEDIQSRWEWNAPPTEEEIDASIRALTFKYSNSPDLLLRWLDVIDRVHAGETYEEIAKALGTSRPRAYQLYWGTLLRLRDIIVHARADKGVLMTAMEVLRNAP